MTISIIIGVWFLCGILSALTFILYDKSEGVYHPSDPTYPLAVLTGPFVLILIFFTAIWMLFRMGFTALLRRIA